MNVSSIAPGQLAELCRQGSVDLIDVRTPAEFRELHIPGARNVPLDELGPAALAASSAGSADATVYLVCRSGGRGRQACERLLAQGRPNVVNVEGGTLAWAALGLAVVRGQKTVSLERQVRIAAGSLVLLGSLLGWVAHPLFFLVPALIGAGLVFAGVTDTCGMGLLLARMPWNRVEAKDTP